MYPYGHGDGTHVEELRIVACRQLQKPWINVDVLIGSYAISTDLDIMTYHVPLLLRV